METSLSSFMCSFRVGTFFFETFLVLLLIADIENDHILVIVDLWDDLLAVLISFNHLSLHICVFCMFNKQLHFCMS